MPPPEVSRGWPHGTFSAIYGVPVVTAEEELRVGWIERVMLVAPHAGSGGQTDDDEADIESTGRGDLTADLIPQPLAWDGKSRACFTP